MKRTIRTFASCLTLGAVSLAAPNSFGFDQVAAGVFGQNTNAPAANTNYIEVSATSAPNDVTTFSNAVAAAWATNFGGVYDLVGLSGNPTIYRATFGPSNRKRLTATTSTAMQSVGWPPSGSFNPLSYSLGTCQSADSTGYSIAIGAIDDPVTGAIVFGDRVTQVGFGILSRTHASYPADIRVTAAFSDGTTEAVTSNIGNARGTDDTFFGFTAPAGKSITNLLLESFNPGTTTAKSTRIAWDDLGFITTPTGLPYLTGLTNYLVRWATNGIQFELSSLTAIDPNWVSVALNSSNVTSQLIITGEPTNRLFSFNALEAGAYYSMVITVTNTAGTAIWTNQFYTPEPELALYNSHGFTDDVLYPLGALQGITDGWATWTTNAAEPSAIVDVGGTQGKVLERLNTGATRADFLEFPPVASGTLIVEFDVQVSSTATRTLDVALLIPGSTATMASLLTWSDSTQLGKLSYYNNTAYVPLMDWPSDLSWHHCKVIHYLTGPAAGRFDVLVDDTTVGLRIPWRNAPLGSVFGRLRIESTVAGAVLEYSHVDNLVVTVAPEDPNAFISPTISNLTPTNAAIIRPSDGIHFEVTSWETISASDVAMVLDGVPVSLVVTGSANHYYAAYNSLTEGNHSAFIYATNSLGTTTQSVAFIATDEVWLPHPADGWAIPWQWGGTVQPELRTASPIDGTGRYLHLDATGGVRNLMRQYQSASNVDITQPHYIRWKFRLAEDDFNTNFDVFNDRVHFFARNGPRLTGSTDANNTWAISATGAEQTPGSGISAGQTFWIYDNVDGSGAYSLMNLVDSHIQLLPQHVYAFEVLVSPGENTYLVGIVDETGGTSFNSAAPHRFRSPGATATSHTLLHFGVELDPTTILRPFDLDSVFVTQAALPVILLNPVHTGSAFSFSFASVAGVNYSAQTNATPASTNWGTLTTIAGDGTTKTVTHLNPPAGGLYYRVEWQSP